MEVHAIVLFDGDCLFCNKSIRFITKHDTDAYFSFATLQGQVGETLRKNFNIPDTLDSLVLIENNRYYDASTAALRICKKLNGIYKLGALFLIVPKPLRDLIYNLIANRRHKIGRQTVCQLPSPEEKKRYMD